MSSGIVKKQAELSISHAFSQHWSVCGRTSIALSIFIDGFEQEEEEHYGEFKNLYKKDERIQQDIVRGCAGVTFWPVRCHSGLYFRIGGIFGSREETDIESCIGYFFRIWSNIHADIAYETYLISSFRNGKMNGNGFNIGIHYKF